MERISVKYLRKIPHIKKTKSGDWIDLYTGTSVTLEAGKYVMIPLGVAIQLPQGYEAIVAPRSSTFGRWGVMLANSIGIIDESYCGDRDEWHFPAYATRNVCIPAGTRICQFRIIRHQPDVEIVPVDTLGNPDRGGFGSTGV